MGEILIPRRTKVEKGYELLADITVGTATTSVDITGLNIGKGDEVVLVSDVVNPRYNELYLYVNENYTNSQYYSQELCAVTTGYTSSRSNDSVFAYSADVANKVLVSFNIKLTNSGHFIYQAHGIRSYGGSAVALHEDYGTSTVTMPTITSLRIKAYVANGIEANSRFQLYRIAQRPPVNYLYNAGNEIVNWEFVKSSSSGTTTTFAKNPTSLYAYVQGANGSTLNPRENTVWCVSSHPIDVTNISRIGVNFNTVNRSASGMGLAIHLWGSKPTASTGYSGQSAEYGGPWNSGEYELNVSSLIGNYYVAIMWYSSYSSASSYVGAEVDKIWYL